MRSITADTVDALTHSQETWDVVYKPWRREREKERELAPRLTFLCTGVCDTANVSNIPS